MRIKGSLPFLPQRLTVRMETRRTWATSRTVKRSGRLLSESWDLLLGLLLEAEEGGMVTVSFI